MLFEVQRTTVQGRLVLRVRGDLDVAAAPALGAVVEEVLGSGPASLVVDLSGTTFLDSSGARQLSRTVRRAADAGVPLQLVCPAGNRPVRLVLDLLELHRAVPVVERADFGGEGDGS